MANYQITDEQIEDLLNGKTKKKLKKMFPEFFEVKLKDKTWYKYKSGGTQFNITEGIGYGINALGEWVDKARWLTNDDNGIWRLAKPEEVKEALEKECIKRFGEDWETAKIEKCMCDGIHNRGYFRIIISELTNRIWNKNGCIFDNGEWAEPLKEKNPETFTLEVDNTYVFGRGEVSLSVVQNDEKFYNVAIGKIEKTEVGKKLTNDEAFKSDITMLEFQSIESLDILLSAIKAVKKIMKTGKKANN